MTIKWSALPLAPVVVAGPAQAPAPGPAPVETPSETPSAGAPAAAKRAASSAGSSSFADIFSRPMEESSDEEEEVPAAAALETDLEKYLKLPELPLTMWPTGSPQTSSRGGSSATTACRRTLRPTALRACRASFAWPVSTTTSPPPPQALSGCSRQRAAPTTTSRAP